MHLRSSILGTGTVCTVLLSLSGCAQHSAVGPLVTAPNPFGYDKVSSLCQVAPLQTASNGALSVDMTVGSGEGACSLSVSKEGGGNYASFGVNTPPEHGKVFLYNYDGRTYIRYTPVSAYDGSDQFGVELIPTHGQSRRQLTVKVKVSAVGVNASSAPAATTATPASKAPGSTPSVKQKAAPVRSAKKSVRHHPVRSHH